MEAAMVDALKPSLRREFIFQQALREEILYLNGNTVVGGEDFSVDDLLDFSNGEFQHHSEQEQEYDKEKHSLSVSSLSHDDSNSYSSGVSYDSIFSTELVVPVSLCPFRYRFPPNSVLVFKLKLVFLLQAGDLEDLEWVSHFVDDSIPELSLLYPVRSEQANTRAEPEHKVKKSTTTCFPSEMKITTKARTTRKRKSNARLWSLSPLLSRPSSPSSCSSVFSSTAPPVVFREPPAKKQKKKVEAQVVQVVGAQLQRRCSHCHVQKTPQWRTGPLGAKTLCNACGVRYKSGRLFSEYRPACSPTFCSDIHSNSHRKVLEIRRKKDMSGPVGPEAGLAQTQLVSTY
ncbi:GATA transcription factor 7-like isoform X1 [Gastrolobium bilobum]|uniref:GATA transcription factor 7-like isoform X1 n=1 Tax=Gastrolobium bilobum TaxID=150636 RepID=UPI002AAFD6CB|nr:GATA transcription factor 7-like isoform X1 [Gastrolobium bilobum]